MPKSVNIPERLLTVPVTWQDKGIQYNLTLGITPSQYFNFNNACGGSGGKNLRGRALLAALKQHGGALQTTYSPEGEPQPAMRMTCLKTGQLLLARYHERGKLCDPEPGIPAWQAFCAKTGLMFLATSVPGPKGKEHLLSLREICHYAETGDFRMEKKAHKIQPPLPVLSP